MQKRVFTILVAAMVAFSLISSNAFADKLNDKSKKLKDVKKSINHLKDKIDDVKEEKSQVTVQITKIESQISKISSSIEKLNSQIIQTKGNIEKKNQELSTVINDFNKYKKLYVQRLKAMYMNGSVGYLEVILSANDFSDVMSRIDMIGKVMKSDQEVMKNITIKENKIAKTKKELLTIQQKLLGYQRQEQSKKTDLSAANKNKKIYYSQLKDEQARLERELKEEEQESKALEVQIKAIMESLAKNNDKTKYTGERVGIVRAVDIGRIPTITSSFGMRFHPILKKNKMHTGVDISVPTGTPVYSMSDGTVIIAKTLAGYGKVVAISHGSGISSLYAHNSQILVKVGQKVAKGQLIAKAGSTGYSTGPHVHFEVSMNGTQINPMPYLIIGK